MVININENDKIINDSAYQDYLKDNPGTGYLKVRASSASEAMPIEGVNIIVSKKIGDNTIIFYDGKTDSSGMINNIKLPTPRRITNNEEAPSFSTYNLRAVYPTDNFDKTYDISLCCSITVVQYINITPDVSLENKNGN